MSDYTAKHARAGINAKLPALDVWPNQFPGYVITTVFPEYSSVCPKRGSPTSAPSPSATCLAKAASSSKPSRCTSSPTAISVSSTKTLSIKCSATSSKPSTLSGASSAATSLPAAASPPPSSPAGPPSPRPLPPRLPPVLCIQGAPGAANHNYFFALRSCSREQPRLRLGQSLAALELLATTSK
jgi:hypothetical protein